MRINDFKCDSCQIQVPAKYNGEHHLPPSGWLELMDSNQMQSVGHLCDICRDAVRLVNLRSTKQGKAICKQFYGKKK